jgi:hypothetical protein
MRARTLASAMKVVMMIGSCILLALPLMPTSATALASGCAFVYDWDGTYNNYSSLGSTSAYITTYLGASCQPNGESSWEMVVGPGRGYSQGGWEYNNNLAQSIFMEWANMDGTFHDQYWSIPTGVHNYETEMVFSAGKFSTDFYVDNNFYATYGVNWTTFGNQAQFSAETWSNDDHWPPDTWSSTRYCTVGGTASYCNPTSVFPVASSNQFQTNSYSCYSRLGTDSFRTYDKRDNGNHC